MKRIVNSAAIAAVLFANLSIGVSQMITDPLGPNPELPPYEPAIRSLSPATPFSINVEWIDQSLSETGFRLFRQTEGGEAVLVKTYSPGFAGSGTLHQFTDAGLKACTRYCYRVSAYNSTATSISDTVCTSTATATRVGTETSHISNVAAEDTNARIVFDQQVSWAAGYHHYFREYGAREWTLASIRDGAVTGLLPETSYCFLSRPYDCGGEGAASNQFCTRTMKKRPSLPTIIGTQATENTLTILWRDNATDEDGYRVWMSAQAEPAIILGGMNGEIGRHTFAARGPNDHRTIYVSAIKALAPDATVSVEATTLPATLPDLRPGGLYATSDGALHFSICNDGQQNTGLVDVLLYLDGDLLVKGRFGIPLPDGTLGVPARSCVPGKWQTTGISGSHGFKVTVSAGAVEELNSRNNSFAVTVTLP